MEDEDLYIAAGKRWETAMDVAMDTTIFGGWGITAVNDDCDCHNGL